MKTTIKIKLLLLCLFLFPSLYAQVTFGIIEAPADGALLQLKSMAGAAAGDENAEKGLLLPRVLLVDYMSLEPILKNADDDAKKEHIGLIVYNLSSNLHLAKGLAVWNGTQWNCITNKEMTESIGMDVKKNLYSAKQPNPANSVVFHSIEVNMNPATPPEGNLPYYGVPQFKIADSYKPTGQASRIYEYQILQYWNVNEKFGYSYDVSQKKEYGSGSSTYEKLDFNSSVGSMSPRERNEVWMYDQTSKEVFHIQFFIMGESADNATKIYAILVEQF
jgi:hypothetical protein